MRWSTERSEVSRWCHHRHNITIQPSDSEVSECLINDGGGWWMMPKAALLLLLLYHPPPTVERQREGGGGGGGWLLSMIMASEPLGEGAVSCGGGEFESAARTLMMMLMMLLLLLQQLCLYFWKVKLVIWSHFAAELRILNPLPSWIDWQNIDIWSWYYQWSIELDERIPKHQSNPSYDYLESRYEWIKYILIII